MFGKRAAQRPSGAGVALSVTSCSRNSVTCCSAVASCSGDPVTCPPHSLDKLPQFRVLAHQTRVLLPQQLCFVS